MSHLVFNTLLSLVASLLLGFGAIPLLTKLQSKGQPIRELGPKSHLITKQGTPTMGGVLIVLVVSLLALVVLDMSLITNQVMLFLLLSHAILGAIDDFMKLQHGSSAGIRAKFKFTAQLALAAAAILWLQLGSDSYDSAIKIPVVNYSLDLGMLYLPFAVLVIVASSNSVNLTDGLDGLVSIPVITVTIILALLSAEVAGLGSILIGACLGFLWHNSYPARMFMGDVGSLAIGALIGGMAIIAKQEIIFAVAGAVFVAESASVILQVCYFKASGGKRIFPMTPIHHSFEQIGLHEVTVVTRFWIASVFFALIAILLANL